MKTAGDVLSKLFDESFVKKAHTYSKLFDSWPDITEKNGITAASAHSRVKELKKGILLIEMDHPAWKQLLQTKQSKLLNDFRIRFPDMGIIGISLMLGNPGSNDHPEYTDEQSENIRETQDSKNSSSESAVLSASPCENISDSTAADLELIKDEALKQKLIKLGQTIAERESSKTL